MCPVCKNDDKATHKKAKVDGDTFTIVDVEALAKIQTDAKGTPNLMEFTVHKTDDLDGFTLNGDKVYFLECEKGSEEMYDMLTGIVERRPDLTLLSVWASRSVPAQYRLTSYRGALALQKVAWPGQIREVPTHESKESANAEKNGAMVEQLLEMAIAPYDPANYRDTRAEALNALIAASNGVQGAEVPGASKPAAAPAGGGLTAMLEAALAAAGAPAADAPAAPKKRAPRKKAAA